MKKAVKKMHTNATEGAISSKIGAATLALTMVATVGAAIFPQAQVFSLIVENKTLIASAFGTIGTALIFLVKK